MIKLDNVDKTFQSHGQVTAVQSVSFEGQTGEMISIQGASGCGKSTLLLCCGGLLKPDSGSIHINDTNLYQLSANKRAQFRAQHIGFVFQQFHLIPYLNVRENILAAGLAKSIDHQRADELIQQLGLEHRAKHKPNELSAGQRQRIAFARSIFHKPSLLLADEPTGNLDPQSSEEIMELIKDYAQQATVLLVTHDQTAANYASRHYQMANGQLSEIDAA